MYALPCWKGYCRLQAHAPFCSAVAQGCLGATYPDCAGTDDAIVAAAGPPLLSKLCSDYFVHLRRPLERQVALRVAGMAVRPKRGDADALRKLCALFRLLQARNVPCAAWGCVMQFSEICLRNQSCFVFMTESTPSTIRPSIMRVFFLQSILCFPLTPRRRRRNWQTSERVQSGGDLSAVDALLGCPLHLLPGPTDDDSDSAVGEGGRSAMPSAARILVDFYAANWFVEVLGAFAGQSDPDMRSKAVRRANQLWALLSRLDTALRRPAAADLPLPNLNADADADAARPTAVVAARPGRSTGRVAGGKENMGAASGAGKAKGKGKKKGRKGGKKAAAEADVQDGAGSDEPGPNPDEPDCGGGIGGKGGGGGGGGAANGGFQSKTRVQQAAAAGFATDLPAVRAQLGCFRELSPTILLVRYPIPIQTLRTAPV